jgi:hypothetical protein
MRCRLVVSLIVQCLFIDATDPAPGYAVQSVSRLDQPTSGALVLPRTAAGEATLTAQVIIIIITRTAHGKALMVRSTGYEGRARRAVRGAPRRQALPLPRPRRRAGQVSGVTDCSVLVHWRH